MSPSPGAPISSLGLPPERRLRRAADFKRLYAQGRRLNAEGFTAVIQPNSAGNARLGLSVAARLVRRAVQRNRVRRLIRESFRQHQQHLPAMDIVVGLRSSPRDVDNAQLRRSLEKLWQKITTACDPSSVS
ncbi:MAG TPA: ribonuclease P protein component [Steroidobacteraceae bacterium]|nr:ribonuclease P protein component [Steroidobacteraceae bacterium]